jgi:hypothetical protein
MEGTALDMTSFSYYFVSSSHQSTHSLPSSTSTSPPSLSHSFPFKLFNDTLCKDSKRSNGIGSTENVRKRYKMRHRLPRSINPVFSKRNLNKPYAGYATTKQKFETNTSQTQFFSIRPITTRSVTIMYATIACTGSA